jgi:serine/threonine protein kinase
LLLSPPRGAGEIGQLGGYSVKEVVGHGGMGVVFRAEDSRLMRDVALKVLHPSLALSCTARERFLREARAAASIQHSRVITIFAAGEDNGHPYLAMPLLQGETLERRLQHGQLTPTEAARIASEMAEGLEAIHARGLVHRDIKPANVWLEEPHAQVKLLDLGLVRLAGPSSLTQEGLLVGSPSYMSPEQARQQPVDGRSDLFSLGVVLFQMLSGTPPFDGEDALTTLLAIISREPPPLPSTVPSGLADVVGRLLAKKPKDRPGSAREARQALSPFVQVSQELSSKAP